MDDPTPLLQQLLAQAATEYDPRLVPPSSVSLSKLGITVQVQPLQAQGIASGTLFEACFAASPGPAGPRIEVTCVGVDETVRKAAAAATTNWCLGVLPVLGLWRGDHTCFATTVPFAAPGPRAAIRFTALAGPIVEMGDHTGDEAAPRLQSGFLGLLGEPLRAAHLRPTLHWLECYAVRTYDGTCDATCRLDNKDWAPGKRLLVADARKWPGRTQSLHSRRQFLLLVPESPEPEQAERRSFMARVLGRG